MEAEAQKDLNIQRFSTPYDKNKKVPLNMMDCEVLIEEGELLMGIIDKNSIGNTKSGGITHVLMNDRGPDAAKAFLGLNQRMVNYWLMNRGFSVGLGDMVPTPETMNEVMDLIAKAKRKVTSLIQQGQHTLIVRGVDAELGGDGNNHAGFTSQLTADIDHIALLQIEAVVIVCQRHGAAFKANLHQRLHRSHASDGGGNGGSFCLGFIAGHKADHSSHSDVSYYK